MKIVITLEVPDGATITMAEPANTRSVEFPPVAGYVLPNSPDIPLPEEAIALPEDATARQLMAQAVNTPPGFAEGAAIATPFRGAAMQNPDPNATCPVHHVPWDVKPAGVSKQTGKGYKAFWKCSSPERCDQRPPYAFVQSHPIPA